MTTLRVKQASLIILLTTICLNIYAQYSNEELSNEPTIRVNTTNICLEEEWKMIFNDEFNNDQLDTSKWYTYYPYDGNRGDQCEYCRTHGDEGQIMKDENVFAKDGILHLEIKDEKSMWFNAERDYSSGMIHSKETFNRYHKFEMRAKIPKGHGFWPAFWLFGWTTEIDIFEFGSQRPRKQNIHIIKWGKDSYIAHAKKKYRGTNHSKDFRTYVFEYDKYFIHVYVDDKLVWKFSRLLNDRNKPIKKCIIEPGVYNQHPAYPRDREPLHVIAGVAVGVDGGPFTNAPKKRTILPNKMEIDYIRVYERSPK